MVYLNRSILIPVFLYLLNSFAWAGNCKILLTSETEISPVSSRYLAEGIKQDSFEYKELLIDGHSVNAKTRMSSFFKSDTDSNDFHLSALIAEQMLSQTAIIHIHKLRGLDKKTMEVWMAEITKKFRRKILNPEDIRLSLSVKNIEEKRGKTFYDYHFDFNDGCIQGDVTLVTEN